jgi:TatD DNase family protein
MFYCLAQVLLACELRKPLFLHERDAHTDMLEILDKYKERLPAAVIHCFTGTGEQAMHYLERGVYLGLTGMMDFTPLNMDKKIYCCIFT